VDQKNEEAAKVVRKAADLGEAVAKFNMGLANDIGSGTTQKRLGNNSI
jgi:TPR repeat protein